MKEKKKDRQRNGYLAAAAGLLYAVLLALAFAGVSVWNEYKQSIIDNQKQQMLLTAQSLADNLQVLIEEYKADLEALDGMALRRTEGDGEPDWTVFQEYARAHHAFVYDIMLENGDGEVVRSMKGHKITTIYSVSAVDSTMKLYQASLDNGEIYLILKKKTGHNNSMSLVIDGQAYYQSMISGIRLGTNGYVVVKDSRGTILMHPDREQWGIDVIYGRRRLYPDKDLASLENMIDKQNQGQEGVSEYYSYWWTEPGAPRVKKISAYSPAPMGQDFLVVSAVIDYDDIYIPIAEGTGGIAHEFNNLLTPIMGYAELLMADLDEECEGYDSASEIYEASVKAKEIIQQISSLSRKNMETAYKNMGAERMMKRALKMVRSVCPSNVHLETDLDFRGKCILGNETQLNQVILNICVNSIHAIGREDGRILVRGRTAKKGELECGCPVPVSGTWDEYVRIDIEDNGCGMSQDVLKQIFDPFFTTKKGGKGTGLGLALVEQIVTSHRGYIYAQSQPGNGSVFHLYLPVNEQTEPDGEETGTEAREPGLRLLIADDNPKVLGLLEKNFHRLKIPVVTAMGFEEAGKLLKPRTFDAVVADQYMEGGSAVDFYMSIQGQYPGLIKIVMADKVDKELAEARQRGIIDGYIDKPVSDTSILKALRNCGREMEA